jgi:ATP-dependent protease HslVU (ClpYQ) peptidase subunit
MSVIATRVYADRIEIASDSQITYGATMQTDQTVKLFTTDTGITIGGVGTMQELVLLKLFMKTHFPAAASEDALTEFIHEFRQWLTQSAELNPELDDNEYHIIFEGKAFSAHRYNIREIFEFDAIGAGMDYALTALYLGRAPSEAVRVACELNIFCSLPVVTQTHPRR